MKVCIYRIIYFSIFIVLSLSFKIEANLRYGFDGDYLRKFEKLSGEENIYCANKINIEKLGISKHSVEVNSDDVYVSSDERYFIFHGAKGKQGKWRFFIVDINQCKVIRELTFGEKLDAVSYSAAFSPKSEKFYVTWQLQDKEGNGSWLTKEYSGVEFKNEKVLRNVIIPQPILDAEGNPRNQYQFTDDGKYLVVTPFRKDWYLSLYNTLEDEELVKIKNRDKFFGKKVKFKYLIPPDVKDSMLLFNFNIEKGTELNIYDFLDKKMKMKIEVAEKGIGKFTPNGEEIIFSTVPRPETKKKDVLIYATRTGKQIGKAILDADAVPFDTENNGIIYRQNKELKRIEVK